MNRRGRLEATLRGRPVDRPAVSFYEIGGWSIDPDDPDPFNIYNDPSWLPLLQLAEEKTDLIRMASPALTPAADNCRDEFFDTRTWLENGRRFTETTLRVGGREMTSLTRRDPDIDTVWTVKHLLEDLDDLDAFCQLPEEVWAEDVDVGKLQRLDADVGDTGIVMVDSPDPLCLAAGLFAMDTYTIVAMTEPERFTRLLEKLAGPLQRRTEQVARRFPGHLWRIFGPEYAAEPYLPPRLFEQYVVRFAGPMIDAIHRHGGYARIHCHGRLKAILPHIVAMGADATDPVEPPPQGDMDLADVRSAYGDRLVLFGNIEVADLANLPPEPFETLVRHSLRDGAAGPGRGFVLMPSAAPYGRELSARTMTNYETMVRLTEDFSG